MVGQHWRIGDVTLEVSEPRVPCYKLGIRMEDPGFPQMFSAAHRPGAYLRIVEEGSLAAGDRIVVHRLPRRRMFRGCFRDRFVPCRIGKW